MNEERRMILEMLKDGAVTVEEAERLMEAMNNERPEQRAEAIVLRQETPGFDPKRILILVSEAGRTKTNIKLPFSLVRAALKIGKTVGAVGAKYAPEEAEAMDMLKSIDIDEILEGLNDGEITLPYVMIDVDDDEKDQHIKVVLE